MDLKGNIKTKKEIISDLFFCFNFRGLDHFGKTKWRKARDSNPRAPRRAASFQDWCIQPLYQLSDDCFMQFHQGDQAFTPIVQSVTTLLDSANTFRAEVVQI